MALQTLVENAVKYGVERHRAGSDIAISARREPGLVRITVSNEGSLARSGDSLRLGLDNARKRLEKLNGGQARLDLTEQDGRVIAAITLPDTMTDSARPAQ